MNSNLRFQELVAVLATIDAASLAVGASATPYVPVGNFGSFAALVSLGVFGASGTVDVKLMQAMDASGTNAKPIANKAVNQLLAAGGNNRQVIVEARAEDLDAANGFAFVAAVITVGAAATQGAVLLLGANPRYVDTAAYNNASVAQLV